MALSRLLLSSLFATLVLVQASKIRNCGRVSTINRSLRDLYCDQPLFVNVIPKSEETQLFDNVCMTFFPMPDDPSTFQQVASIVYCDGSSEIVTSVSTDISQGVHRGANPFTTFTAMIFGYAGCDTYLHFLCANYLPGSSKLPELFESIIGLSSTCSPLGLSCLRKIEEIIEDHGLPDQDFYVLPMKLPNRCVTQRQCVAKENNPFHKALGISEPLFY